MNKLLATSHWPLASLVFCIILISCYYSDETAVLTIKNNSGIDLDGVKWNGTNFGKIPNGKYAEKAVKDGKDRITFRIEAKNMDARVRDELKVDAHSTKEFVFKANTQVEEINTDIGENKAELQNLSKSGAPSVDVLTVLELSGVSAMLRGSIKNTGFPKWEEYGICYSKNLADLEKPANCFKIDGEFILLLEGLTPGEKYYAKAYIDNRTHLRQYGEVLEFLTKSVTLLFGCWIAEADPKQDELCFYEDYTGKRTWNLAAGSIDYEGFEFEFEAGDKIKASVVREFYSKGTKSSSFDSYVPPLPPASSEYEVSPDSSVLVVWSKSFKRKVIQLRSSGSNVVPNSSSSSSTTQSSTSSSSSSVAPSSSSRASSSSGQSPSSSGQSPSSSSGNVESTICKDSQNRPLFCRWNTGCYPVDPATSEPPGHTCDQIVSYCPALYVNVPEESEGESECLGELIISEFDTRCRDAQNRIYFCQWGTKPEYDIGKGPECWAINPAYSEPPGGDCASLINECQLYGYLYVNVTNEGAGEICNGISALF